MGVDDFFYNGKSKTGSFLVSSAGNVCFVKTFPDFRNTVFGNSDSVIFDRDKYPAVFFRGFNNDRRVIRTEFDGIIQKIVKYLLNLFYIRFGIKLLAGQDQLQKNMASGAVSFIGGSRFLYGIIDIKGLNVSNLLWISSSLRVKRPLVSFSRRSASYAMIPRYLSCISTGIVPSRIAST